MAAHRCQLGAPDWLGLPPALQTLRVLTKLGSGAALTDKMLGRLAALGMPGPARRWGDQKRRDGLLREAVRAAVALVQSAAAGGPGLAPGDAARLLAALAGALGLSDERAAVDVRIEVAAASRTILAGACQATQVRRAALRCAVLL